MNKFSIVLLFMVAGLLSCKNSEKNNGKLELAKQFYAAIDDSNPGETIQLISEQLTTIDDGFTQNYSRIEFAEWIKWDAVFQPSYRILNIQEENGTVKAKVSKTDKRISFLHHEPIVAEEIIHFDNNKISRIDRTSVSFNVERFVQNRDELVNWIGENHPELEGFLNDQTKSGGMNYLKAIELYTNQ